MWKPCATRLKKSWGYGKPKLYRQQVRQLVEQYGHTAERNAVTSDRQAQDFS